MGRANPDRLFGLAGLSLDLGIRPFAAPVLFLGGRGFVIPTWLLLPGRERFALLLSIDSRSLVTALFVLLERSRELVALTRFLAPGRELVGFVWPLLPG